MKIKTFFLLIAICLVGSAAFAQSSQRVAAEEEIVTESTTIKTKAVEGKATIVTAAPEGYVAKDPADIANEIKNEAMQHQGSSFGDSPKAACSGKAAAGKSCCSKKSGEAQAEASQSKAACSGKATAGKSCCASKAKASREEPN